MKEEYFNLDGFENMYTNIDYLNPKDLENINGDNLFLAFVKEKDQTNLKVIAAIDGELYDFNAHKYLNDNAKIIYARAFSDIMPSTIWRLVYIANYDIIAVDIDDYKSYLIENFENFYSGVVDKDAKAKILRNGYITSKFKKTKILTKQNLQNIDGSNIFLAILENLNIKKEKNNEFDQLYLMETTYEGIEISAKLLKSMIKENKIILPNNITIESWIETFKEIATDELDKYWHLKLEEKLKTANFITSINGSIYNLCTNEYLNYNQTKINYAKQINEILPNNKWHLSYSDSDIFTCITVSEDSLDALVEFECTHFNDIDKLAKTKVLKNGYKITN